MESSATMACVLKVKIHCEICKKKVMQVLQNLHGCYSFVVDAEKGTVEVQGKVNPELILRILGNNGTHAEIKSLRFNSDVQKDQYFYDGENRFRPPWETYPHPMLGPQFIPPQPPPPSLFPLPPPPRPLPPVRMQREVPPAFPSEMPESCILM
ncbi:hypothetical protein Pint_03874 [Pistacia integerrima]|uniref:Uncharacterized protein n=1 Tax=Pistacia integerrima TaxID=434235 RepID=A0ACC0Z4P7_9ROSI|nr:hypothetical protein Pint_03874 [Pistacia integerrima]